MTIKERLANLQDDTNVIYLGNIISNFRQTEMYDLLLVVTEQQIMAELSDIGNKENADKRLGRLEGIRAVLLAFESYETFRDQIIARKKEEEKEKLPLEEPPIRAGGGSI